MLTPVAGRVLTHDAGRVQQQPAALRRLPADEHAQTVLHVALRAQRDPPTPRRYAYCSDTAYAPDLVEHLDGVDLLYHEATFTDAMSDRARETCHSTAKQAAMIDKAANVGTLLLGHFSSRYKDNRVLLDEALPFFANTLLAEEGRSFHIAQRAVVDNSDAEVT